MKTFREYLEEKFDRLKNENSFKCAVKYFNKQKIGSPYSYDNFLDKEIKSSISYNPPGNDELRDFKPERDIDFKKETKMFEKIFDNAVKRPDIVKQGWDKQRLKEQINIIKKYDPDNYEEYYEKYKIILDMIKNPQNYKVDSKNFNNYNGKKD